MSLHYDLAIACDLKPDTPQQVIETLQYMTRTEDYVFNDPPDHEFFTFDWNARVWRSWLQIQPGSTYMPGEVGSVFRHAYRYTASNQDGYRYTFSFRSYLLDDGFYDSWWRFAEWLAPHSESIGCVGYYREESDWQPTLIYFRGGGVYTCKVTQTPTRLGDEKEW